MHRETEDGKGPADVHFACAMRYVDAHIEQEGKDVITPRDLVAAINHGDGMNGCIGELYSIDLKCQQYRKWETSSKKGGELMDLGRVNTFKYREFDRECGYIKVDAYSYRYSKPLKWRFEMYKSSLLRTERLATNRTGLGRDDATMESGGDERGDRQCILNLSVNLRVWKVYQLNWSRQEEMEVLTMWRTAG